MSSIQIISDKNFKSKKIKSILQNKINNIKLNKLNITIVVGGDGFMLQTLKKYKFSQKIFYGLNSGNYGFLMNKFSKKFTIRNLTKAKSVTISPLEMTVSIKNKVKKCLAINEVSILRQSRQTTKLEIYINKKLHVKQLTGDGFLIATPAGSTAYNLSAGGQILHLDSKKIAITPISPFRPRGFKGKAISNKSKIIIKNLDFKKRPVSAVADNNEIRDARVIKISINKQIKFKLLYNKKFGLKERNLVEQSKS